MDRIIFCDEACEILKIKTASLYKLINTGKLKSFKHGGRRVFMESAITEYIKNASGCKPQKNDNIILTPTTAMAKGLEHMDWLQFNYDELCDIWSIIGNMKKQNQAKGAK